MSRIFWNLFSATQKATFGALTPPTSPNSVDVLHANSPADLLSQSGAMGLRDIMKRRDKAEPFQMGHIDEFGQISPTHTHITNSIKEFFLSDARHLEVHRNYEASARRPNQYFDVRQVGITTELYASHDGSDAAQSVQIFCCRYGEELQSQHSSKEHLTLAIPSLAGLKPPDAISLVNPLGMQPREYIDQGEAGAILCFSPASQRYVADLYWSPSAFIRSLSQVQEIGKMLIKVDAIGDAAQKGIGVVDIHRASAILAKLYEAVAQLGQAVDEPFFSAGIWGVAVLPQRNNTYRCVVGVVALEVPHMSDETHDESSAPTSLFLSKRDFAVANFCVYRDDFGFIKISSEDCKRYPLEPLAWFDKLPEVN